MRSKTVPAPASTPLRWLALGLLLALAAAPAPAQQAPLRVDLPGEAAAAIDAADAPFAVRAESLVGGLAEMAAADLDNGTDHAGDFLRTLGLEPTSTAARQLVALARALEAAHPLDRTAALGDDAAPLDLAAQQGWVVERYRRVGEGLGGWLRDRGTEGWAVEPLVDRLLNGPHLEVVVFSSEDGAFGFDVAAECDALKASLERELGYLPRRLDN